jgi:hypothetical protein
MVDAALAAALGDSLPSDEAVEITDLDLSPLWDLLRVQEDRLFAYARQALREDSSLLRSTGIISYRQLDRLYHRRRSYMFRDAIPHRFLSWALLDPVWVDDHFGYMWIEDYPSAARELDDYVIHLGSNVSPAYRAYLAEVRSTLQLEFQVARLLGRVDPELWQTAVRP